MAEPVSRTPRPVAGRDIRTLPLTPPDAFLLSRIDGSLTEVELASLTGFDLVTVIATIDRLAALGAIEFNAAPEPTRPPTSETVAREPQQPHQPQQRSLRVSQTNFRITGVDVQDFDEISDLDNERKHKVSDLYARLPHIDYYALLGVPVGADRKDIKRAYYSLAPDYHPDKFYGKTLGSFKPKMEVIFAQLTFAYETLSSPERRAEYDTYLSTQAQTRSMEELLRSATGPTAPSIDSTPLSPIPTPMSAPSVTPPMRTEPASPVGGSSLPPPRSRESDRARREALARKLGIGRGSLPPEQRRSTPPPEANREAAAQELKRRHDMIALEQRRSQARRYMEAANAAMKDNPAAAANAYRLALSLDPQNPEIVAAHKEASKRAAVALADGYLKQADYESRSGRWGEAARSYMRAVAGLPEDPIVLQKTAQAQLKSGGDLRQAAEFCKRAIAVAPNRLEARLTLIEVFIAAGFPVGARREFEAAREIAPRDDRIIELSKRLK